MNNSYAFIVAENERLIFAKNEPNAPKDYILESIEANKIRLTKLMKKKLSYFKKRDRLNGKIVPIVDEEIIDLDKSDEESKSEVPGEHGSKMAMRTRDLEQENKRLREDLKKKEVDAEQTVLKLKEQISSIREIHQKKIIEAEAQIKSLQQSNAESAAKKDVEITRLTKESDELRAEIKKTHQEVKGLKSYNQSITEESEKLRTQIASLLNNFPN